MSRPPAAVAALSIADVQSSADARNIAIDSVGVKDLSHPIRVADRSGEQSTVASVNMYVALPPAHKGTHMSRIVDVLHDHRQTISVASFSDLLLALCARLDAPKARIQLTFPFFVTKRAPVSGLRSMIDYQVTLRGEMEQARCDAWVKVVVPVTSLCPCSKEIAEYGAHNQRAHVMVEVRANAPIFIEELIALVEAQASSELYGLLKRPDEKFITEKAYNNPKFVEDMVRDVAGVLNDDARITHYQVSVENFESIHNHSAYAHISRDKTGG